MINIANHGLIVLGGHGEYVRNSCLVRLKRNSEYYCKCLKIWRQSYLEEKRRVLLTFLKREYPISGVISGRKEN